MKHPKNLPEDYQTIMPYLIIPNADTFFDFMQKVFGAEQKLKIMREESSIIMHAELMVNGSCIMYAQCNDDWKPQCAGMFIYVDNADECFQKAKDNGSIEIMPLENRDYGRGGGVQDPFGNTWWITSMLNQ